ncbi:ferredoxin reductase family protein [Rathayibacter soli]|uniref:ferredoxin reductase family protein n=1 Tax=Rathayibacter soli TaxID=3144168 RepID=UPI0027E503D8|nr:ferredoxin reductase family protein [Glaciibacter superstes]
MTAISSANQAQTLRRRRPPATRARAVMLRLTIVVGTFIVLFMWWATTPAPLAGTPAQVTTTIGELSGMLGGYLVCVQVLLIARIPWFEAAVGLDRLVAWHRTLGTTVVFLIVTHVIFMVVGGMFLDKQLPWSELITILQSYPDMLTALIGTIAFLLIGFSSARAIRARLSYEVWYWLHVSVYAAIFLTFLHQLSAGVHFINDPANRAAWLLLYLATAAAVLTWRVVLPLRVAWRHRLRVEHVVAENAGTTSVWFSGRNLEELGVRAGNFMSFRFLSWGHLLTAHPYSISRVPDGQYLRITVGALGNHSRAIRQLRPGTLVFAEGPFGHFTADRATRARILLIAGGSGIGPIRALAEDLVARGHQVVLLYRARSGEHLALWAELNAIPSLVVIPLVGRRQELGYDPLSAEVLSQIVPDLQAREVFLCGPEGMALQVVDSLHKLRLPSRVIHREELSMS